jgi:hypothetical protein
VNEDGYVGRGGADVEIFCVRNIDAASGATAIFA